MNTPENKIQINPLKINELKGKINIGSDIFCSGLYNSARWFAVSAAAKKGLNFIILPDKESAEYCAADLYNLIEGDNVFFLPESGKNAERSNYRSSLRVQRTSAISKIINNIGTYFIVTFPEALIEPIPSVSNFKKSSIKISKGEEISYESIKELLLNAGFEKVDFVSMPGQYSFRGSIIDIFSYSFNNPYRLSFFGNEIENIHVFDCNTQLSEEEIESIEITGDITEENEISISKIINEKALIWLDSSELYNEKEFYKDYQKFQKAYLDCPISYYAKEVIKFNILPQPAFNKNFEILTTDIRQKIENNYKVYIFGEKESQLERLKSILIQNGGLIPEFIKGKNLHSGFIDKDEKICCYTDHEIFDRFHRVSIRRSVDKSEQLTINDLSAFNVGDYVVHIDNGVGIFGGLVKMTDDKGRVKEVVKIMYKDGDVVFVSVHALNKISRYRSKDGLPPKINKLGSKTWQNLKISAKSKIKDIAKELIQLYAKRKTIKGFAFSSDSYLQEELESSFIYEDTPDQETANKAVKRDMEDNCPMDRLICGDVGFGKTEIAIRAAFKAVLDSKQVVVLVPTTILSLQHYNTFKNRLKGFPCNIDYISRLRTAKEVTAITEKLKSGEIDIIIATHKILGKGFEFKDLGLLIIDEEQKFGVSAKEKLRAMKLSVDTLTLTATPIPRTLQFSLLGARDLSIIATPPPNRIPIQTEIILFDEKEIKSIINYEINRGGQLYFLHNKVEELDSIYEILHRLVPDIKICIAHGQMEAKKLENRMMEFIRGDYDLLLCTTIIESGLDIPNANTIIINQAQNIGLSDLHQLRGRVGRSNKKAFCYLIVPPLVSITDEARRRLKAIEEFSELGSGFNIAMQDLDIRGAGNLLGAEQSGFIADMGYETYQKILSEAMAELGIETGVSTKKDNFTFTDDCMVETDQPAVIPDTFIDLTSEKIRIYKELDSIGNEKELEKMKNRLTDRFGKLPIEIENLFDVVRVRNIGASLGFEKIIIKNGLFILFFISNTMSPYYKSETFSSVLKKINEHQNVFTLKQVENKLKIVARNVDSMAKACELLKKLQN